MNRYSYNCNNYVDRRTNVGPKLNRQPACVSCNNGFGFKDYTYPTGPRCPLLLNCGHSVCENCIRTLLRNGEISFTCNVCSKVSTVKNKLLDSAESLRKEFPLHIYLVGQIVLRVNRMRIEDDMVSFASNKNKANNFVSNNSSDELCCECTEVRAGSVCRQCEVALCDGCFSKIHMAAKALQKHERIPLLKKTQASRLFEFCKDHSEQKLEFFCKDCEVATCAHCFICNHRNHDLMTLKEKNAAIISELGTAYKEANEVLKRLHFTRKKLSNVGSPNTPNDDYLETEKAIASHFSYLHGLLQLRETELMEEIKAARMRTQHSLQDVSKELDQTIKEMEDVVFLGHSALDPSNVNLYDLDSTLAKLKETSQVPCHLVLSQDLDNTIPYKFTADDIAETILTHCNITVPKDQTWYLSSNDDLPEDYKIEEIPTSEGSVKKTSSIESQKQSVPNFGNQCPFPPFGKRQHSDSEVSTTSTDSFAENIQKNALPSLKAGTIEQVTLCHLLSPSDFYVHRKVAAKNLMYYSQQFSKYTAARNKCPENVTVGTIYLKKFVADNKWYRARVIDILNDNKVEIYYIDYGNTEITHTKNLRTMPLKFLDMPGLALHCSLCHCVPVNGEWSPEAINIMANITSNVEVTMHIFNVTQSDIYEVDLSRQDIGVMSLRDAMIFLNLATLTDLTHQMPMLKKEMLMEQQIKPNSTFIGLVTMASSPSDFYIQRLDENGKYLENLMDDMNKMYCRTFTEKHLVYAPVIGMAVAAKFSLDDKWYRALVTALPGNRQVEVFYVDYGNSEVLMWDRLRYLQDKFLRMSCQALRCTLCDVAPKHNQEWSAEATSWFTKFTDKKPVQIAVIADTKPNLKVVLYEQLPHSDVCINALLVMNNYAMSTGENSTVVDFPRSRVHPEPAAPAAHLSPVLPSETITSSKYKKKLRSPKKQNQKSGTTSILSVTSKTSEQTCTDKVTGDNSSTTETENDSEDLFRIPVTVLNIISPALFYVSISNQMKQIKQLSAEMAEFYANVTTHNAKWAVDNKCAVMRKSDKTWYRGVIVEILPENQTKVLLKDIASVEVVYTSNLVPLDEKFLTVRDGAVKCHLSGIVAPGGQDTWPGIATEIFIEELDKYPQIYMSKLGDILNESLPVELFVKSVTVGGALEPTVTDWKTINQILVDRGFALPIRNNSQREYFSTTDLLKDLENRPRTSMEELVTSWLHKTNQDLLNTVEPAVELENNNEVCQSMSGSSSPSIIMSVKSLNLTGQSPQIPRPLIDINAITEWLPAVPFKTLDFVAYPTNVDSECAFYLQDPSQSKDTLQVIQNALSSRYKDSKPMPHDLFWFPGQLCIAQYFDDKCWYRAKVLKVNDNDTVDVQFVDFGNVENCKASELRKNIFMGHIPIQCHRCTTPGILPISPDGKWPVPTLDFIHATIVEKMCRVELKEPESPSDTYKVLSLKCPGNLDLMELLMSMHYATYFINCDTVEAQEQKSQEVLDKKPVPDWYSIVMDEELVVQRINDSVHGLVYPPAVLPKADECLIEVTGVLTALDFVVQIVDCTDEEDVKKFAAVKLEFEALSEEMQKEAENRPPLLETVVGAACCACYTEDNKWYRATIIEIMDDNKFKVQYVDFGNVEILTQKRIRSLKNEWCLVPLQGITVHLWGVCKPHNFNAEKTGKLLLDCLLLGESPVTMKIQSRVGTPSVEFYNKDGKLCYQSLLDQKLFKSTYS